MPYSSRTIQIVAYRLHSRYHHLFTDVERSWIDISALDDIPLEWVKIWEEVISVVEDKRGTGHQELLTRSQP